MILLTDGDKKFVENIKDTKPVTDEQFEKFWSKNGDICKTLGFTKDVYRDALKQHPKLNEKRCENCRSYLNSICDVIEEAYRDYRHLSLFWIYTGNSCSEFERV
jgi:hypothetical protein